MMKKTSVCLICLCAALLFPSIAAALALDDAVQTARKNNPAIQAAKSRWEAFKSIAPKAYALPDPKIGAEFEDIPAGSADLSLAGKRLYKVSQDIPWPGMLLSEAQAADIRADMEFYSYRAKEREVVKKVKAAYFALSETDRMIKLGSEYVALMRQGYAAAQAKYSAGKAPFIEALKMQIELDRMENELKDLMDERQAKNRVLGLLLNLSSEETLMVDPLPGKTEEKISADIAASPRLKMEEAALAEMRAMKGAALAAYAPETMVKWKNARTGPTAGMNDLMFEFSVPLWFPLSQNRTLDEAEKNIKAAENAYQAMKNMLLGEAAELSTAVEILRRRVKLYDARLLASARQALESSLAGYKSGKVDFMLLLDSLRAYLDINRGYYETLAEYHTKAAELMEITGRD